MHQRKLILCFLWMLLSSSVWAAPPSPQQTWVFVASLVKFQNSDVWHCFNPKNRRDVEVPAAFASRGVPADHIVTLLDQEATREHLEESLQELLDKTRPGDMLYVYYQGHGWHDSLGEHFYWVPYDGADNDNLWEMARVKQMIQSHFRGSQYLVISDCCDSGCLRQEAKTTPPW